MDIVTLLFSPEGRIGRGQFWFAQLLHIILVVVEVLCILSALRNGQWLLLLIVLGTTPVSAWMGFCVIVKRLHDRDKSGFFYLLMFVPFASIWLFLIECGCMPGSPGTNSYGNPPSLGARRLDTYTDFSAEAEPDIDAMIARAKATILAPQPRNAMAGGQMAMARPAGPPVFGKRR